MAVMARIDGIPSRLVSGYAGGDFDEVCECYLVTEAQGHSWAELYFPGFGWIPFEATPSRPVPLREHVVTSLPESPVASPAPGRGSLFGTQRNGYILLVVLSVVLIGPAALIIWTRKRHLRTSPILTEEISGIYGQLVAWGDRLDVAWHPAMTSSEYLTQLADRLRYYVNLRGAEEERVREAAAVSQSTNCFAARYSSLTYGPLESAASTQLARLALLDEYQVLQRYVIRAWVARAARLLTQPMRSLVQMARFRQPDPESGQGPLS